MANRNSKDKLKTCNLFYLSVIISTEEPKSLLFFLEISSTCDRETVRL